MARTVAQPEMQHLYYDINPTPHSEKAYQAGDPSPPIGAHATVVGPSGKVAVLQTTLHNKKPHGAAEYALHDSATGHLIRKASGTMPFVDDVGGLAPGMRVYIQPLTIGTMAKILTPEQIAAS